MERGTKWLPYKFNGKTWDYNGYDLCDKCLAKIEDVKSKAVAVFLKGRC